MGASAPQTVAFAIRGPITSAALPGLCDRVCALLSESGAGVALCDVRGVEPDAVTVDALARRIGRDARARRVHGPRRRAARLVVQPGREAEEREEPLRVEEERELPDRPFVELEHLDRPGLVAAGRARLVLAVGGRAVRRAD